MSLKVFGRGTGADCRNHVQRLNTMRGEMDELKQFGPQETAEEEGDSALQVGPSLTLKGPIATKVVCFSCLLKCLRCLYGKQCGPSQTAPIGAVCSGSMLFVSILNLSLMLGNYLQQTTFSDEFFS